MTTPSYHTDLFPHPGGCEGCRAEKRCNYCGGPLDHYRCTNGRCSPCHACVCTPGGDVSPGHGYGKHELHVRPARTTCQIVPLRGSSDDRHGRTHEVFAPAGFRFDAGEHSKLAYGLDEAKRIAAEALTRCPEDCECRDED